MHLYALATYSERFQKKCQKMQGLYHKAHKADKVKPQSWHCQADTNTVDLSIGVSILISIRKKTRTKWEREGIKHRKQLLNSANYQ